MLIFNEISSSPISGQAEAQHSFKLRQKCEWRSVCQARQKFLEDQRDPKKPGDFQ
jgi:hypothetical protein